MRAVIVRHEEHEGAGWFGPALEQSGFELVHRFRGVEADDALADLLVVLGGSMSACALPDHPFLVREVAVLTDRLRRCAPCLGICLGAQLLARAAGARVHRGANGLEVGAAAVSWTAAAQRDPAIAGHGEAMVVAHWHQDTFTPVPGAVLLASSARYTQQAFRLGASFGFQFHLELDAATFAQWLATGRSDLAAAGHDGAALQASIPRLAAGDAARAGLVQRLAQHFAASCRR